MQHLHLLHDVAGVLLIVVPEAGASTLVWQDQAWWSRSGIVFP